MTKFDDVAALEDAVLIRQQTENEVFAAMVNVGFKGVYKDNSNRCGIIPDEPRSRESRAIRNSSVHCAGSS